MVSDLISRHQHVCVYMCWCLCRNQKRTEYVGNTTYVGTNCEHTHIHGYVWNIKRTRRIKSTIQLNTIWRKSRLKSCKSHNNLFIYGFERNVECVLVCNVMPFKASMPFNQFTDLPRNVFVSSSSTHAADYIRWWCGFFCWGWWRCRRKAYILWKFYRIGRGDDMTPSS